MKRIILAALTLLLCLPTIARADDASRRAKIEELFTLMHIDRTMKQVMDGVLQQVKALSQQQLAGKTISATDQKKLDAFQQKVFDVVNDQMGWKQLEPDYVKLYSDAYSEEEIDGILNFYKSPIGQTMLAKTPELTSKALQLSQQRMKIVQPQLMQLMQDFLKDVSNSTSTPTSK